MEVATVDVDGAVAELPTKVQQDVDPRRVGDSQRQYFVSGLECSETGKSYPPGKIAGLSRTGRPLLVRYDLKAVARAVSRSDLLNRAPTLWRYRELLPIRDAANIVSLGETITPILGAPSTAAELGMSDLLVKDEGRMPTGSFKARGMSVAVSMAKELGLRRFVMASAANAGAALAAYSARAGMKALVFCPEDSSEITLSEMALYGAEVFRVADATITDLAPMVAESARQLGLFNISTFKEPYRVEGKKTMGFELAEQCDWTLPDVIFYPTGGGTGLVGMWKAFDELEAIGWIGRARPRMVAVQSSTCAPIVRAFEGGNDKAPKWDGGHTRVHGLRVPYTIGDALILRALTESRGFAIAVDDDEVEPARAAMAAKDGIHLSPEGAATLVACRKALAKGLIRPDERAVLFNCGSGLKSPMPPVTRRLDLRGQHDFRALCPNML